MASDLSTALQGALVSRVSRIAADQGVKLIVGSNVTPEITAYDATDTGAGVLDLLGIRPYARVENKDGVILASYGQTEPIDWIRSATYWGLIAVGLFAIIKGFAKR